MFKSQIAASQRSQLEWSIILKANFNIYFINSVSITNKVWNWNRNNFDAKLIHVL